MNILKVSVKVIFWLITLATGSNCKIAGFKRKLISAKVSQKWPGTQSNFFQIYENEYSFCKIGFEAELICEYVHSLLYGTKNIKAKDAFVDHFRFLLLVYWINFILKRKRAPSYVHCRSCNHLNTFSMRIRLCTTHLAKDTFGNSYLLILYLVQRIT